MNLDTAYAYFVTAASHNDPLGHNGLGYIYFRGTNAQVRNRKLAFKHFNESAYGGSSDGMFNLASMRPDCTHGGCPLVSFWQTYVQVSRTGCLRVICFLLLFCCKPWQRSQPNHSSRCDEKTMCHLQPFRPLHGFFARFVSREALTHCGSQSLQCSQVSHGYCGARVLSKGSAVLHPGDC